MLTLLLAAAIVQTALPLNIGGRVAPAPGGAPRAPLTNISTAAATRT